MGYYTLPRDLNMKVAGLINPIVTQVGLPVMARLQNDTTRLKKAYLKSIHLTSSINFPIYTFIAFYAPEIISLLFGQKWEDSTVYLQILAVWAAIRSTGNPVGSLALALGQVSLIFRWNVILAIIILPIMLIASNWGLMGISSGMLAIMAIQFIPQWFFLVRPMSGASLREYLSQFLSPTILSVISGLTAIFLTANMDQTYARMILGGIIGAATYIALCFKYNKAFINALATLANPKL
jgi:O-antigen/teichoic acid export membrane protein